MDRPRFTSMTRRRVGIAAAGLAAARAGLRDLTTAQAKKKHKQRRKMKRCKKLGETCVDGGRK